MAVVQNTLIGRSRGRVGNVIFTTWKGLNIIKQKAEIVANPRSALQIANRLKFQALLALGRLLRPILQTGFKEYAGQMSWLNRFMSVNSWTDVLIWNGTDKWELTPENLVVSEGALIPTPFTLSLPGAGILDINWATAPINNQQSTDEFLAVVICGNSTKFILGGIARSVGTAQVDLSAEANLEPITVVSFFMRYDMTIVSNSLNVGGILVNP